MFESIFSPKYCLCNWFPIQNSIKEFFKIQPKSIIQNYGFYVFFTATNWKIFDSYTWFFVTEQPVIAFVNSLHIANFPLADCGRIVSGNKPRICIGNTSSNFTSKIIPIPDHVWGVLGFHSYFNHKFYSWGGYCAWADFVFGKGFLDLFFGFTDVVGY